jgi:hypothetical protein
MAHRPRLEGGTQPILPPMGRPIPGTMRMTQPDVYTKNWTLPLGVVSKTRNANHNYARCDKNRHDRPKLLHYCSPELFYLQGYPHAHNETDTSIQHSASQLRNSESKSPS